MCLIKTTPICLLVLLFGPASAQEWYDPAVTGRVPVDVDPAGYQRVDKPVEVDLDFAVLLQALGKPGTFDPDSLRVVDAGSNQPVPFQLDTGTLVFIAVGTLDSIRRFHIYFDAGSGFTPAQVPLLVSVTDGVVDEGWESFMIESQNATYYYHKECAGFSSLEDADGNDWISYAPSGGSAGDYRGIPNLGDWAHPGRDALNPGSELLSGGPVRVRIRSATGDGAWEKHWDIFPKYARMTLDKSGGNYWFLYEGTPGGGLDANDYCVRSPGTRTDINTDWHEDLPDPEWAYFGDESLGRIIYLIHHEDDNHSDQFWQMQNNMTVFGFGREYTCCGMYMTAAPAHFTVGLADATTIGEALPIIDGAWRPLQITVGEPEEKSEPLDGTTGDGDDYGDDGGISPEDAGMPDEQAGDDAQFGDDGESAVGGSCSCAGGVATESRVIGLVLVLLWLRFRWGRGESRSGT